MTVNVGTLDRILRISVGIIILAAGYYFKSWWGAIGLIPLTTGIVKFCPLYPKLKMTTLKKETTETAETE